MKLYCWLFGHKVKKAKVKDVIKETVEAIMRHEKAYGTISPEFIGRLLATALEEQKQELLSEVEGWLVDEEIEKVKVSHVSARRGFYIKTKDPSAYVRNKLRAELRARLNQLKDSTLR